jgi:hypothetical protein
VLVNHRRDPAHIKKMTQFWRARGITQFLPFDVMNRGGALFVDDMQYDTIPQRSEAEALLESQQLHLVCSAPFLLLFVGYDGNYYLCCSDWKKEVPLGTVFETSFAAVMGAKLEHVETRMPICKSCNHDPVNRLTDKLRGIAEGTDRGRVGVDQFVTDMAGASDVAREIVEELSSFTPTDGRQRRIPLTIETDTPHP